MKQRDLMLFLASVSIVVFAWIAFSIVHNSFTSTINSETQQQIIPIKPDFDSKTIDALQAKLQVSPEFTIDTTKSNADKIITQPTTSPSPIQVSQPTIASQSGGVASSSGGLR